MTSKKHRPWARELSQYWQRKGVIEYCELRFEGCFGTYGLAPAHSKDRRDIHTKADFFQVVCACSFCHNVIDRQMPKDERLRIVKETIQRREI